MTDLEIIDILEQRVKYLKFALGQWNNVHSDIAEEKTYKIKRELEALNQVIEKYKGELDL